MSCNHAYVNFKFQPRKDGAIITIFSSILLGKQGYCESKVKKFIVTYLSCLLLEKQGYLESKNILNYELSLVYGKSP
jgi:hypothetical protein